MSKTLIEKALHTQQDQVRESETAAMPVAVGENDVHRHICTIPEAIEEIRNGRMVVLVDDEDRENEGDLVVAAQMATPEAINFMAKNGRGLVCLALEAQRIRDLGLPMMARTQNSPDQTAFTTSIEAREGITTGISAADRARTISVAIDPTKTMADLNTPGHVFPLAAKAGGVLERAGHTEAAVDLARLAGLNPAGVICEIMKDDGEMARLKDLLAFATSHNLKVATIADLIAHRLRTETTIERVAETTLETAHAGSFKMVVYQNILSGVEHIALIKNHLSQNEPVLVRMHALNVLGDVLFDISKGQAGSLHKAMQMLDNHGSGLMVLLRNESAGSVSRLIEQPDYGKNLSAGQRSRELRDYGMGAQILRDLGVRDMLLLTNSAKNVVALEGYGITIHGTKPIDL